MESFNRKTKKIPSLFLLAAVLLSVFIPIAQPPVSVFSAVQENNHNQKTIEYPSSYVSNAQTDSKGLNFTRIIVKAGREEPDIPYISRRVVDNYTVYDFSDETVAATALELLKSRYDDVSYSAKGSYNDTGASDYSYLSANGGGESWVQNCGVSKAKKELLQKYGTVGNMPKIVVAVIDSGIDRNHELFADRINSAEYDFTGTQDDASDTAGHGTTVAGIIADLTLPNVKINAYRVGDESNIDELGVVSAVRQAIRDRVHVINISLGFSAVIAPLKEALDDAIKAGITVVVSAGNDSDDVVNHFPASYSPVITVSAVDYNHSEQVNDSEYIIHWKAADYSNYGASVDIAACGHCYSAMLGGGYEDNSGTSFSAPIVAAAAAMYLTYYPDAGNMDVEQWLKTNAVDFNDDGFDASTGFGVVQMSSFRSGTVAPAPVFSEKGSVRNNEFSLTISVPSGYEMYYTLDGTLPVLQGKPIGKRYTEPLLIDRSTDITVAVVGKNGEINVSRERYYINEECLPSDFSVRNGFLRWYFGTFSKVTLPTKISGIPIFGLEETFRGYTPVKEVIISDGILFIGDCSFHSSTVEKIYIGKDVCRIGCEAFYDCHAKVTLSSDNRFLETDGRSLYSKKGVLSYYDDSEPVDRYVLPDAVTHVNLESFYKCLNLNTLVLGKNVVDIDYMDKLTSFVSGVGCMYYHSVTHPVRIQVDPDNPFFRSDSTGTLYRKDEAVVLYCPDSFGEKKYIIPSTAKRSAREAYAFTYSVSELILEEGVEEFDKITYSFDYGIKNVYIPSSMVSLTEISPFGTEAVHVWFAGDAPNIQYIENSSKIVIHCYPEAKGFDKLKMQYPSVQFVPRTDGMYHSTGIEYPFAGGTLFFDPDRGIIIRAENVEGDVIIPESINGAAVKEIGAYAFAGAGIDSLVIPKSVTYIRKAAFLNSSVQSVRILGDIKEIEYLSFCDCFELDHIEILGKTETIGPEAFKVNESTTRFLILPDSIKKIDCEAFQNNIFTNINRFPNDLEILSECSFPSFFDNLQSDNPFEFTIPSSIKTIHCGFHDSAVFVNRSLIHIDSIQNLIAPCTFMNSSDNEMLYIHLTGNLPEDTYMPFPGAVVFCDEGVTLSEPERIGATVMPSSKMDEVFGHSFTNYVSNGDATCTQDGTKTAKCDHEWCPETNTIIDKGSMLGHSIGSDGVCTRCKQLINPVTTAPITTVPVTTSPVTTPPITTTPVTTEPATSPVTNSVTAPVTDPTITPTTEPVEAGKEEKKNNTAIIIVSAVAAVAIVGNVVTIILVKKKKK